jgi:hypothetical protein
VRQPIANEPLQGIRPAARRIASAAVPAHHENEIISSARPVPSVTALIPIMAIVLIAFLIIGLIVTAGCGWVQRDGGPIEDIRPGDVVWFAPAKSIGTAPHRQQQRHTLPFRNR